MKKLYLFFLCTIVSICSYSQSATSVANGNWMNPFTWSCTCVPLPGYSVTINHAVMLDTSFYVPSGSITINSSGSLTGNNPYRDIWVNGGSLDVRGSLNIRYLWTQTGTFANSGNITLHSFLDNVPFTNAGTFQNIDSLYTTANVLNNGSFLNIDSITVGAGFINNGTYTGNQVTVDGTFNNNNTFTFTDITNNGTLVNADTIEAIHSGWNRGYWNNLASGYFLVHTSFLNGDTIGANASFNNDGKVIINSSWYNIDTTKGGTGHFIVADTTINWGWMNGTFDFCDLTPPLAAPYVDYNFGTIQSGVTWCTNAGIEEFNSGAMEILVYPNPAHNVLNVEYKMQNAELKIYDVMGLQVYIRELHSQLSTVNCQLSAGTYIVKVISETGVAVKRLVIE